MGVALERELRHGPRSWARGPHFTGGPAAPGRVTIMPGRTYVWTLSAHCDDVI